MYFDRFRAARAVGKRSGLEVRVCKELDTLGVPYTYEESTIRYEQPSEFRKYTPDLQFPNGVVVELKGRWKTADRKKIKLVRQQHPDVDLRFVFDNPNQRISKTSKTTYGAYCKQLGIPFAKKSIPVEWLSEPINMKSLEAMRRACAG